MSQYVDSSALVKLYADEAGSEACEELLRRDLDWVSAGHTQIEVRGTLSRVLTGQRLEDARDQFRGHWGRFMVVDLDRSVCAAAAELAEVTGVRSLDALHLAAAQRAGGGTIPIHTYDLRLAQAARALGWPVIGA
jgi:uncharacterized protein